MAVVAKVAFEILLVWFVIYVLVISIREIWIAEFKEDNHE